MVSNKRKGIRGNTHNISSLICRQPKSLVLQRLIQNRKNADILPDFGGFKFPLRIGRTTTQRDGGVETFCGLQMSCTGNVIFLPNTAKDG